MKIHAKKLIARLQAIANVFSPEQAREKVSLLKSLSRISFTKKEEWVNYHELLLFIAAHPDNEDVFSAVAREFKRIASITRKSRGKDTFEDSGLPYTAISTRLSHDMMVWLHQHKQCRVELDSFGGGDLDINTLLGLSLPPLERDETTAGYERDDLFAALHVSAKGELDFLLDQFHAFDQTPFIKDRLWEQFNLFFRIHFEHVSFSRSFNRIDAGIYYQNVVLKKFDHTTLIASPLPGEGMLSDDRRSHIADVVRKSLVLTMRETDPSSFMDEGSLRYFELERGISIAIYGMHGLRQLPLQSYMGFTAFKNGYPVSYGGSWIFGQSATFGINIFEAYRGGESGYVMCQLLRVYAQVFDLKYIEVEPYQFGLDNPDGIKSGAFWFYYRFGFRSVSKELDDIASKEMEKIKSKPGYRTSEKTLIRFTEDYIALKLGPAVPKRYNDVGKAVKRMISKTFKGNRSLAVAQCRREFLERAGEFVSLTRAQDEALTDLAMMSKAMNFHTNAEIMLLKKMVHLKSENPYEYNRQVIMLFDSEASGN